MWTRKPTAADLAEARWLARLTVPEAADLAGLHRTTYARQENGASRVSLAVYRLFSCRAGDLPDPAFAGWSMGQGQLWTPESWSLSPGEIRAIPYLWALLAEYRRLLSQPPIGNPEAVRLEAARLLVAPQPLRSAHSDSLARQVVRRL